MDEVRGVAGEVLRVLAWVGDPAFEPAVADSGCVDGAEEVEIEI